MTEPAAPKPCKRGHVAGQDKKGYCLECKRIRKQLWRDANREKIRERFRQWRLKNIEQQREKDRLKYARISDKYRKYRLRRKYNMSVEEYTERLINQAGLCAICNKPMIGRKEPFVDHIAGTYIVRGLTHNGCNIKLASIEDIEFRENALRYLAEFEW